MTTDEALGRWPRRLLHMPTMTSYEWQPGNKYCSFNAPAYNAITYTWGRYMLRNAADNPDVEALDIHGVPWDIPRIAPAYFTRAQFLAAVQSAVETTTILVDDSSSQWSVELGELGEGADVDAVEFLWLDVACIDQRPDHPDMAAEIARQGDIFRGAQKVFVWLSTFAHEDVQDMFGAMLDIRKWEFGVRIQHWELPPAEFLESIYGDLSKLLTDPWFSSLWTLQEAFLRPDAYFLSREGKLVACRDTVGGFWGKHLFAWNFNTLVTKCASLYRLAENMLCKMRASEIQCRHLQQCLALLQDHVDLITFGTGANPLVTFVASGKRTTSREVDRVYGIQQIFGFCLGASAANAPRAVTFTPAMLQEELGQALVGAFPILSQLHVFTEPVPFGEGWHIGPKSRICDLVRAPKQLVGTFMWSL